MEMFRAIDDDGIEWKVIQLEDGGFACPVCGFPSQFPLIIPAEPDIEPIRHLCVHPVGAVCPCCRTEFGVDIPSTFAAFDDRRTEWLNENQWNSTALQQIQTNLGLTEGHLRRLK